MIAKGRLRGEKIRYKDGVGLCIWYPVKSDEDVGHCFDLIAEDVDDLILLLEELRDMEPENYDAGGE